MSFLFPLFLLAGLTIAIPILIHLFNLRRYKTVYFPNTRFLKNIQLHSQKQSQLRYKWLLASRILFLLFLVLAFAQPYFQNRKQAKTTERLQVIYLDNSGSMSVKKGSRTLLDIAKESARQQLRQATPGTRFILLTNDKPLSYQPIPAEKAVAALGQIDISPVARNAAQVLSTVSGLVQSEAAATAAVYYYSDFQQNSFPATPAALEGIQFYGIPIRAENTGNVFIDTAFFTTPVLQTAQSNQLVVKSRYSGRPPSEMPVLQLSVNGQVKSAASLDFSKENEAVDTLSFQVNNAGWQKILLTVNDATVHFDDTFRIAARSASGFSVLVLNEGQPNPYIRAAFRAYNGFNPDTYRDQNISNNTDWKQFNLIILNGLTRWSRPLVQQVKAALEQGQSVCIFPGKTADVNALNEGFGEIAGISINGRDTAVQAAASLQQGSDLVKDLFENIPENVQLPVATWHYSISAGLSANQQSVLSFRNGDPFLAQYTPSRGKLYLLATAADLQSGNFPGSYFFAPFLYQMAAQSKSSDVFAITAGKQEPVFLNRGDVTERNMIHVYADGIDIIPPQKPAGAGLEVFLGRVVQQPGFYRLAASEDDSVSVALNQDRTESRLTLWDLGQLRKQWKGDSIHWESPSDIITATQQGASFPLWKICVILGLLMLAVETCLLAAKRGTVKKATA